MLEAFLSDNLAVALVIAIFVALATEALKYFDKDNVLQPKFINLITLWIGWGCGMIFMWLNGGSFETYTFIGISAGFISPSVYEYTKNLMSGNNE